MTWYIDGSLAMGNLDVFAIDKTLGNYRVCMIECDDETVSEHDVMANARLIAAAPDLLAALIDAVEALADANYYPSELNRLQAAINKSRQSPDKKD